MIEPAQRDEALLNDIQSASCERDTIHLWWLGQSGFLVQWQGRHLLLDPYLSDSLTRKYQSTDKPHVRMTARAIDPGRLAFVDIITSSHNHTDHLDAESILPIVGVNPEVVLIMPMANIEFAAERLQVKPLRLTGIDAGGSVSVAGFCIHALPSAHEHVERDEAGHHRFLGYVVECGPWRIYHSGDTLLYDGMVDWLKPFRVDVALLPINGRAAERRVAGNLNGYEAAQLAHEIGAGLVIPCHYDMFEFNTASPHGFETACHDFNQRYQVLRCGERWSSSGPEELRR